MKSETYIPLHDLIRYATVCGGASQDLVMTHGGAESMEFHDLTLPGVRLAGNIGLRSFLGSALVKSCNFDGLRSENFQVGNVTFRDCSFRNSYLRFGFGTENMEMTGCTVSGIWEGNISAAHGRSGRRASLKIIENDFREVRLLNFMDGVDWKRNKFDHFRSQLIVTKEMATLPQFREASGGDPWVCSIADGGPLNVGQDWTLLHQECFAPDQWEKMVYIARRVHCW